MMKSKVTCHFCNKESSVFIVYKNSWTCQSCNQYNGFNKDGDYNKPIPEMQKENKKTFCLNAPATPKKQSEATNLLCHRCNASQEQKLKDLSNFEATNEDRFDEEYKVYKQKLDHIYDLCRACKQKLNQHLTRQDNQIGQFINGQMSRTNQLTPLKSAMHAKQTKKVNVDTAEFQLKKRVTIHKPADVVADVSMETIESPMSTSTYKKAYTVSGSSPYSQERRGLAANKQQAKFDKTSPKKYIFEGTELDTSTRSNRDDYAEKVDRIMSTNLMKSMDKWFAIQTIFVDFFSFFVILLILTCDTVNLINDSEVWQDTDYNNPDLQLMPGADQHYIFKTLLRIYKYVQFQLVMVLLVSVYFAYKRPKMSRFLTVLGITGNLLIHLNLGGFQNDEKYIMEVFTSLSLSSYMALARSYNVVQFYRYMKGEC